MKKQKVFSLTQKKLFTLEIFDYHQFFSMLLGNKAFIFYKEEQLIPIILETERKENYASYTAIKKKLKNYTIGIIDFKSYIP